MHELSIALSLIDTVIEEARHRGVLRVTAVHVRVGPLSGVEPGPLASAFEIARTGTAIDGAELVIGAVPVVVRCPTCLEEKDLIDPIPLRCPDCGTPTPDVVSGRELELDSLEVEP